MDIVAPEWIIELTKALAAELGDNPLPGTHVVSVAKSILEPDASPDEVLILQVEVCSESPIRA